MTVSALPAVQYRKGVSHKLDNYEITDHWFEVPLTHGLIFEKGKDAALQSRFADQTIKIFAREVVNTDETLIAPVDKRPYLVYLQGGPGFGSPRTASIGGWVAELAKTYRVILLDQRGTGNSTALSARTITAVGSPEVQAEYAELFRAPSIIADAEAVRQVLLADREDKRWSTLGQSFGGFLTLSYLSFAPHALRDCRMTAGLAPIRTHVDNVYQHTFDRMQERVNEYYEWFPEDEALAARIAEHIRTHKEYLPTGELLTDHRFQMAGHFLGGRWRERGLHYFLESAFAEGDDHLSDQFLVSMGHEVTFQANPLYALMHETIYADGPADGVLPGIEGYQKSPSPAPTNWSAARVHAQRPEFDPDAEKLLFTGEHIFPWYYEEDPSLRPLAEVAQILAEKKDWGRLYDHEQLHRNEVPVVAASYNPDVYVDFAHSMETAAWVKNVNVWTSKTHHHDGLGSDAGVLTHLNEMLATMR